MGVVPFKPEETYGARFTASVGTSCYLTVDNTLQCGELVWCCVVLHLEPLNSENRSFLIYILQDSSNTVSITEALASSVGVNVGVRHVC